MKFQYVIQYNVSNENIRQMKKRKEKFNIQNIAIFKLIIKKRLFETFCHILKGIQREAH